MRVEGSDRKVDVRLNIGRLHSFNLEVADAGRCVLARGPDPAIGLMKLSTMI